jgi:rRNA maturation protein Nop10
VILIDIKAQMTTQRETSGFGMDSCEHCPECGHAWYLDGPAHFADCRFFSLDDDRDEEVPMAGWEARGTTVAGPFTE